MKLKILHRYILKEMIGPVLMGLVAYSFLFLINLIFQLANMIIQKGLSASLSTALFVLALPNLLAYTFPVALLLGTIIAFGKLSSESEIIAMRAGGIHQRKLFFSPLLLGVFVTILMLFFNLWLIPRCRVASEKIQDRSAQAVNLLRLLQPGVFFDRVPNVLLYIQGVNHDTGRLKNILVYRHPNRSQDILTLADTGRIARAPGSGAAQFTLKKGETIQFDRKHPGQVQKSTFNEQVLSITSPTNRSGPSIRRALYEYPTGELFDRLKLPVRTKLPNLARRERYGVLFELHRRFAASVAVLFFVLIGIPLGLVNVRGGKGAGFSLSLVVLLGYWIMGSMLEDLTFAGRLRPELAAWLPDLALLITAAWLFRSRRRTAGPGWLKGFLMLFPARKEAGDKRALTAGRRHITPTILDGYILKRMIRFFVLMAASILLMDWLIEVRGLAEFITGKVKIELLLKYLLYQSPAVLIMLLPFSVLVTVLVTYGMLERSNEILAAKASGISVYRLAVPALAIGILTCAVLWAMGQLVVPGASRRAQALRDGIKNFTTRNIADNADVWLFAPNRRALFHYRRYDPASDRFLGFSLYRIEQSHFRLQSRLFAKSTHLNEKGAITFKRGWRWSATAKKPFKKLFSGTLPMGIPKSYFVAPRYREARFFDTTGLLKLIRYLKIRGYPFQQQEMDYYQKYSDSAAPLVLLLIGLPFAFMTGRRGSLYGIAIALLLVLAYYAVSAVFNSVGAMQWLDPALAAWAPLIIFSLIGGYLLLNLRT